jgi:hypothetical protein
LTRFATAISGLSETQLSMKILRIWTFCLSQLSVVLLSYSYFEESEESGHSCSWLKGSSYNFSELASSKLFTDGKKWEGAFY